MKNDTWFDKLEVGKLFMLNDDINEVYFIWVKISPNKAIKVWDCETLHSDFTGSIDTKKPLLHYFSIYPKELELNVPEKVKQWFQR